MSAQANTPDTLPRYSACCLWPAECQLGEGPLWLADAAHASAGRLLWLDIHGAAVHGLDLPSGQRHRWALPWRVAWLIASNGADGKTEEGVFLAGRVDAVLRLRLWPQLEVLGPGLPIHEPAAPGQGLRLNDAKLDPWGRVWFSGIYEPNPSRPRAELLRLDSRGQLQTLDRGYRIGNGPCFSLDGRTLWHADSGLGCVWAYALDEHGEPQGAQQGTAPRRLWRQFPPEEGVPDGMCVDAQGALWIAHWGGHRVTRYSPQGEPLARIDLPVSQVTSCCFGGVEGRQLFITSARTGLSEAQLAREPLAGGLFVADLPVAGAPLGRFAFDAAALRAGTPWA